MKKIVVIALGILMLSNNVVEAAVSRGVQRRLQREWLIQTNNSVGSFIFEINDFDRVGPLGLREVFTCAIKDLNSREVIFDNVIAYIRGRDLFFTVPFQEDVNIFHIRMNSRFTRGRINEVQYDVINCQDLVTGELICSRSNVEGAVFTGTFTRL